MQKDKEVIEMLQKKTKENQQAKYRFYNLVEISRDMEPPGETIEEEQPNIEGNFTKVALLSKNVKFKFRMRKLRPCMYKINQRNFQK